MRPEVKSRRLFGITRSKGKMFEFGLPLDVHIDIPQGSNPEELLLLSVGILGDAAAEVCGAFDSLDHQFTPETADGLRFAASFFDAFLASRLSPALNGDISLLASSTYYLAGRPGSSLVLASHIAQENADSPLQIVTLWLLRANWEQPLRELAEPYGALLGDLVRLISQHFRSGSAITEITTVCEQIRGFAYRNASAQELTFVDIICAIAKKRIQSSSWLKLPAATTLGMNDWSPVILKGGFPKELWPSQMLLAKAGIFSGTSGLIQMPTSSGKTRSIEIILRSSFMSQRSQLAVIIAPFRALCHEISNSLRAAFIDDQVSINELSDTLQVDYLQAINTFLENNGFSSRAILVLTPEKFLYVLRQTPGLVNSVGLVIYDEGHQFDSGARGVIYELLLTEIKRLLPSSAQTILISAVIQNARAIADWLIGENALVVTGTDLSPTVRSIAFASWMDRLGQLMFYEAEVVQRPDYFVPRVIEQQRLEKLRLERKVRYFPEHESSTDVALYIGLRLVGNGATAIFCGKKSTASNFASRAVEIYERGFLLPTPASFSDAEELRRLRNLHSLHFGESAVETKAAMLGVFCHHGNTPQGVRLSIEYAMQKGMIKFVACTSTLAQGVNLPIRYLIVSGVYQGASRIKVRDFHNLMGRAGRAGMHTEGLIIFADASIYDSRVVEAEKWKFKIAVDLLNPSEAEPTSSSLLSLVDSFKSPIGYSLSLEIDELCRLLLEDDHSRLSWARAQVDSLAGSGFDVQNLLSELQKRRELMFSVESHLMANRGSETYEEFSQTVRQLAIETLAHNLADDSQKIALVKLFDALAQHIQNRQASPQKQATYAKTLLGFEAAQQIEAWTLTNKDALLSLESNTELLSAIWPLLQQHSRSRFVNEVLPQSLPRTLAELWMQGKSYQALFEHTSEQRGTKPWGHQRRALQNNDIIEYCENTLGFDCSLIIAAVFQFLSETSEVNDNALSPWLRFQKAFKYGIPDNLSISCYEKGFADRMVAQKLKEVLNSNGHNGDFFPSPVGEYRGSIQNGLSDLPSYFHSVLNPLR